jgi:DDE superfamily endonuclease
MRLSRSSRPRAPAFTRPTFHRFTLLRGAALLGTGRRTIANLLRVAAPLAAGHVTTYQRVFSSASWSALRLACGLGRLVVARLSPDTPILLAGDDTVDGHPGRRVSGTARHRDPVRSRPGSTAGRSGPKGVVLAVLVRFPLATRPWALPVLVALDRSEEDNRARRRPHRTPAQIMGQLLRVLRLWFPDRRLIVVGDAGSGTQEVARFGSRHRLGLTLVSKLHPNANRFEPPPPYSGTGRPRVKGAALPKPRQAAKRGAAAAAAFGRLVRRGDPSGGPAQPYRSRVQVGRRAGADPLGVRARPRRHPPRRVRLQYRPGAEPGDDHRD